ncbi:MAG: clostripain-related cysteine peptidase, partial [Alistipes sp.]|nr:clostripain-related cysteine peptidase [Alistipes sp.]
MKRNRTFAIQIACCLLLGLGFLCSCSKDNHDTPTPTPTPQPEKQTTLIFYICGDDEQLSSCGYNNAKEVFLATLDTKDVNVVVVLDHNETDAEMPSTNPQILWGTGDGNYKVIKEYREQNVMNPSFFKSILQEIKTLFPAREYGLTLSGHGNAWLIANQSKALGGDQIRDPSQVNESGLIDIVEIAQSIPTGMHLNFILMDACIMASVEVAHELRNTADYLIASPLLMRGEGIKYDTPNLLNSLIHKEYSTAAKLFFEEATSPQQRKEGISISVVDLKQMDALAAAQKKLLTQSEMAYDDFLAVYEQSQRYATTHILFDTQDLFRRMCVHKGVSFDAYKAQLEKAVIYHACTDFYDEDSQFFPVDTANIIG